MSMYTIHDILSQEETRHFSLSSKVAKEKINTKLSDILSPTEIRCYFQSNRTKIGPKLEMLTVQKNRYHPILF
jgi:hypothetical protein